MFHSCKQQFLYYPVIIFIAWNLPSGSFNLTNRASLSWQGVVLCNILNKFENKKTKSRRVSNLFFARCADNHKTSDSKVLISYLWLWHLVPQITSSSIPSDMRTCRENIETFLRGARRYGVRGRIWGNDCFCNGVVLILLDCAILHCISAFTVQTLVVLPKHMRFICFPDHWLFEPDDLVERRNDWKVK